MSKYAQGFEDCAKAMKARIGSIEEDLRQSEAACEIFRKQVAKVKAQRDEANERILKLVGDGKLCETCRFKRSCYNSRLKGVQGCHRWEAPDPIGTATAVAASVLADSVRKATVDKCLNAIEDGTCPVHLVHPDEEREE